jgi:uncharacterized protein (TIGR03435 family)
MKIDGARVDMGSLPLATLIARAYRVKLQQVSGPDWLTSEKFDVLAKTPEGASPDQVPEMLQTLLGERFKLKIHRESREYQAYVLVVGKNGPKMKQASAGTEPAMRPSAKPDGTVRLEFTSNITTLADFLGLFLRQQVLYLTGLKGVYQGALDVQRPITPDAGKTPLDALADPIDSPFYAAVEQIGLKLEARKVPMETIVVDHHSEKKPTEN